MQKFLLPLNTYLWALAYFLLTVLLKWKIKPDITILLYFAGAFIGLHLLEVMELVFKDSQSPFRSVLTQAMLTFVTLFVITSSGSRLGTGVVLFLNLRYLYLQFSEYHRTKTLVSWFPQMPAGLPTSTVRNYIYLLTGAFTIETILFILF